MKSSIIASFLLVGCGNLSEEDFFQEEKTEINQNENKENEGSANKKIEQRENLQNGEQIEVNSYALQNICSSTKIEFKQNENHLDLYALCEGEVWKYSQLPSRNEIKFGFAEKVSHCVLREEAKDFRVSDHGLVHVCSNGLKSAILLNDKSLKEGIESSQVKITKSMALFGTEWIQFSDSVLATGYTYSGFAFKTEGDDSQMIGNTSCMAVKSGIVRKVSLSISSPSSEQDHFAIKQNLALGYSVNSNQFLVADHESCETWNTGILGEPTKNVNSVQDFNEGSVIYTSDSNIVLLSDSSEAVISLGVSSGFLDEERIWTLGKQGEIKIHLIP